MWDTVDRKIITKVHRGYHHLLPWNRRRKIAISRPIEWNHPSSWLTSIVIDHGFFNIHDSSDGQNDFLLRPRITNEYFIQITKTNPISYRPFHTCHLPFELYCQFTRIKIINKLVDKTGDTDVLTKVVGIAVDSVWSEQFSYHKLYLMTWFMELCVMWVTMLRKTQTKKCIKLY